MYRPIISWSKRVERSYDGYRLIYVPEHPKSFRGWYYEHRLVLEKYLDRILEDWETVHHINGDKHDNDLRNLFLCTREEHDKAHARRED